MAGKHNEKAGRNSPSRQRMVQSGRTAKHKAAHQAKTERRLARLADKYEGRTAPRQVRRKLELQSRRREVVASFQPKVDA